MSARHFAAQPVLEQEPAAASGALARERGLPRFADAWRRYPALPVAIVLLALSTALVLWARTRPGFDPYGWLVWGHQTIVWSLNTNAAPSWKPLPYLFTVPFAIFGHYQVWLWMIASVAVSLSGVVFAGRIAYRLTGASPDRRWAAWVAAVFAGLALLGIRDYWHYILSAQTDPMVVSLCLGAVDCHLSGRPRWAFALGVLASLARPEIWLFLGLYSIWAWRAIPSMRVLILGGIALLLVLWFGIPALTSRSPFVAGSNALGSGRAPHGNKVFTTVDRFLDMHETSLEIAALLAAALAVWRRDRILLGLCLAVLAWVVLEIAFALHGWPALPRYMFGAGGIMVVLAGVFIGRLLALAPGRPGRAGRPGSIYSVGALLVVAVLAGGLVPGAVSRERVEHKDLRVQRARTTEINRLAATISRYGGAGRFTRCGEPLTRLEYQTILAWNLHVNVAKVGFKYGPAIASRRPIVLFTPGRHGWKVQALHQRLRACRRLPR